MSVQIRLYQEGNARTNGFQGTEWADTGWTAPARYADLFVLRKVGFGAPDLYTRVATPDDFGTLPINRLTGFEPRNYSPASPADPFGAADKVYIKVDTLPHWVTTTTINGELYQPNPSGYIEFPTATVETWDGTASGDGAPTISGARVRLTSRVPDESFIGRTLFLQGFTTSANNGACLIIGLDGDMVVTNKTFTTETAPGATWAFKRMAVPATKPFPRIENGAYTWQLSTSGSLTSAGTSCAFMRDDPDVALFRDLMYTSIHGTTTAVKDHFTAVKTWVEILRTQLANTTVAFDAVGPYDYGP
jgi:hypothetical protein